MPGRAEATREGYSNTIVSQHNKVTVHERGRSKVKLAVNARMRKGRLQCHRSRTFPLSGEIFDDHLKPVVPEKVGDKMSLE